MRPLDRLGLLAHRRDAVELAVMAHLGRGPQLLEHGEELVRALAEVAFGRSHRGELLVGPAVAQARVEPAGAYVVKAGQLLGEEHGGDEGHVHHGDPEPDRAGLAGQEGEGNERVVHAAVLLSPRAVHGGQYALECPE
jgi:hypothetical protein